jgi:hypothetical protein
LPSEPFSKIVSVDINRKENRVRFACSLGHETEMRYIEYHAWVIALRTGVRCPVCECLKALMGE